VSDDGALRGRVGLLAAVALAALTLRPQLVGLGPVLPRAQHALGVSHALASLLSTIPVIGMGVFAPAAAPLAGLAHLRITGLMAIPPMAEDPEASRPWFRRLRELRDALAERPEWRGFPGHLSMGMSDDFAVAVEEGATHVRVGTALFGPRRGPI